MTLLPRVQESKAVHRVAGTLQRENQLLVLVLREISHIFHPIQFARLLLFPRPEFDMLGLCHVLACRLLGDSAGGLPPPIACPCTYGQPSSHAGTSTDNTCTMPLVMRATSPHINDWQLPLPQPPIELRTQLAGPPSELSLPRSEPTTAVLDPAGDGAHTSSTLLGDRFRVTPTFTDRACTSPLAARTRQQPLKPAVSWLSAGQELGVSTWEAHTRRPLAMSLGSERVSCPGHEDTAVEQQLVQQGSEVSSTLTGRLLAASMDAAGLRGSSGLEPACAANTQRQAETAAPNQTDAASAGPAPAGPAQSLSAVQRHPLPTHGFDSASAGVQPASDNELAGDDLMGLEELIEFCQGLQDVPIAM